MHEKSFICPYCAEQISVLLDPSVERQTYVEDCEVCCNPMEISLRFSDLELIHFEVRALGQ